MIYRLPTKQATFKNANLNNIIKKIAPQSDFFIPSAIVPDVNTAILHLQEGGAVVGVVEGAAR